jgi:hypothetical protein
VKEEGGTRKKEGGRRQWDEEELEGGEGDGEKDG